ncbi:hypothetical protein L9G74_02790 [Shewanella sp. C32]|uniref:Flagellin n=1 Tax=Shewanella electrica TaxID=515560 RepID=A0ABT2FGJ5_9GAMM|nr:hypothetical protein [Shewanella electrica]MCH1923259.1 hypothetical protein [Shewanella electrica]MCS4555356.1 hypothetical protein [Shewanella electrica]
MQIDTSPAVIESQRKSDGRVVMSAPSAASQVAERDSGSTSVRVTKQASSSQHAVLSRWVSLASIAKSMSQSEHSTRTLQQLSRQLKSLDTQIEQTGSSPDSGKKVNQLVAAMKRQLQQGGVNNRLQSQEQPTSTKLTKALTNKVDLLSPKAMDETVSIVMGRSGKAVSLALPAGASRRDNLQTISQAFAGQNIDVSVSDRSELLFHANGDSSAALKEPWLMMGTGVRVAAGNPVAISLNDEPHALDDLQQLSQQSDTRYEAYSQEIAKLQRSIKSALEGIEQRRQQILMRLQQVQRPPLSEEHLTEIDGEVQKLMQQPTHHAVPIIIAQANITRNLVSFSLSSR